MKLSENRWMFNFPELIRIVNKHSEESMIPAKMCVPCILEYFPNNLVSHKSLGLQKKKKKV